MTKHESVKEDLAHEDAGFDMVKVIGEREQTSVSVSVTSLADTREALERAEARPWNEATFFDDAQERVDPKTVEEIRQFYDGCQQRGFGIRWGKGAKTGSFLVDVTELSERNVFVLGGCAFAVPREDGSFRQGRSPRQNGQLFGRSPTTDPFPPP